MLAIARKLSIIVSTNLSNNSVLVDFFALFTVRISSNALRFRVASASYRSFEIPLLGLVIVVVIVVIVVIVVEVGAGLRRD